MLKCCMCKKRKRNFFLAIDNKRICLECMEANLKLTNGMLDYLLRDYINTKIEVFKSEQTKAINYMIVFSTPNKN